MAVRVRRVSAFAAVLAAVAVLVPAGLAGARDDAPGAYPTLYVVYTMNCTFSIVDDFGRRVTSIAPGTYQVEVSTPMMFKLVVPGGPGIDHIDANDFTGCKGWVQFSMTGPGVDLFTTLDTGCDAFLLLPPTTFKANSTFVAQDLNQPSVTRTALTTLSSGAPAAPTSPYTPTSGKGTVTKDIVGSAIVAAPPLRGTLSASLSPTGKPTLTTKKGKPVSTLRSGRYKFVIDDKSPKGSFTIEALNKKPNALTGVEYVGKRSKTVNLKPGRWAFYSGLGKTYYYFLVTN